MWLPCGANSCSVDAPFAPREFPSHYTDVSFAIGVSKAKGSPWLDSRIAGYAMVTVLVPLLWFSRSLDTSPPFREEGAQVAPFVVTVLDAKVRACGSAVG